MKFKWPDKERISPNYTRKMSDVLMEFVREFAPADSTPATFATAVDLAVLLWNMALLTDDTQARSMDDIRAWLVERGRLDLQTEIEWLIELRRTRYGSDRRMIVDHKVSFGPSGPQLTVVSLDADRPENRAR